MSAYIIPKKKGGGKQTFPITPIKHHPPRGPNNRTKQDVDTLRSELPTHPSAPQTCQRLVPASTDMKAARPSADKVCRPQSIPSIT